MPRLGGPTVTSNGRFAVYSVTYTDPEDFTRAPKHYLLDLGTDGADPVELDFGIRASSLAFGSDDFVYFISSDHTDVEAESRHRVWRVALEADGNVTGPMLVADIEGTSIAGFKLAPTSDKIALWAEIDADCERFGCGDDGESLGTGRLYEGDAGFFRHWDTWIEPGKLNRVFVFGLEGGVATGDGVAVDGGMAIGNTPTRPFGGGGDIAWAPDGSGLYFVARESNAAEPTSTDLDIYWSDLSGGAPTVIR